MYLGTRFPVGFVLNQKNHVCIDLYDPPYEFVMNERIYAYLGTYIPVGFVIRHRNYVCIELYRPPYEFIMNE